MSKPKVYRVTDGDMAIFQAAEKDPDLFTDWYLRGENTGTWATPISDDSRVIKMHREMTKLWKKYKMVQTFNYEWEKGIHEVAVSYKVGIAEPFFHLKHGFFFNDWQKLCYLAQQETVVVMGGFGGGKTIYGIVDMLIKAATLPGFLGMVIAPYTDQSKEVFDKGVDIVQGTRYAERFMTREWRERPHPTLFISNSHVGESRLDFRSILDDPNKVLNLERDMAMIDQAEQIPDIVSVRRAVATRLRGFHQGRERVGKTIYIANPYENPEIWDLYDEQEEDPENVFSVQVSSYDNTSGLSEKQVAKFERAVGKNEADKEVYLKGNRPVGEGKLFPKASVEKCLSATLDEYMTNGLKEKRPGFRMETAPRVNTYIWETPPLENAYHVVIADPGFANPPNRNSAVIGVWDITNFPDTPAHMRKFHWVIGNGSPDPWMQSFYDSVFTYKAVTRCAFDSSGWQSGYQRWVNIFEKDLQAEGMQITQSSKFGHLNAAKVLMSRGLIQFPSIDGIISQLAKYDLPDEKMRQDIVMMIALTCGWLERGFYMKIQDRVAGNPSDQIQKVVVDRNFRSSNRMRMVNRR